MGKIKKGNFMIKKITHLFLFGLLILGLVSCGKGKDYTKTLYLINIKNNYGDPCKKLVFYSNRPGAIEWAIKELGIKDTDEIKIRSSCQASIKYSCEDINVTGAPGYNKILKKGVTFKFSLLYEEFDLGFGFIESLKNRCHGKYGGSFKKID